MPSCFSRFGAPGASRFRGSSRFGGRSSAGYVVLWLACVPWAHGAVAGQADVIDARGTRSADGTWTISATVRHADEGWDHYADRWDVVGADGQVLASRKLLHPHEAEQPFTRSLSGVRIPSGLTAVTIRAHDSLHGLGGREFELALPR